MLNFFSYKLILFACFWAITGCIFDASAQKSKPRLKLGTYYFDGWEGKSPFDDGKPEHAWARGMPVSVTKKLTTDFSGRTPIWGWRDDTQEVMERQIDLAADNGISFFSFCWFWMDNKGPINIPALEKRPSNQGVRLFMQAKNTDRMEFCLLVANHGGFEIVGTDAWRQAADYWIENYFKHPGYLRVDGKPVIMIFSTRGSDKDGLAYLQEAARKAGFPGILVTGCGNCSTEEGYQAQTAYNTKPKDGLGMEEIYPFKLLADWNISVWNKRVKTDMPYIPTATQGWDRRPWEAKNGEGLGQGVWVSPHFQRPTAKEFEHYIRSMSDWMDSNPKQVTKDRLGMIYAWNEIGEGGWIVPCKDDPNGIYLKAIRYVFFGK